MTTSVADQFSIRSSVWDQDSVLKNKVRDQTDSYFSAQENQAKLSNLSRRVQLQDSSAKRCFDFLLRNEFPFKETLGTWIQEQWNSERVRKF